MRLLFTFAFLAATLLLAGCPPERFPPPAPVAGEVSKVAELELTETLANALYETPTLPDGALRQLLPAGLSPAAQVRIIANARHFADR